jgi:hypothetical protein
MQKFEVLPESAKKEVADFIDRLLQKRPSRKKKLDKKKNNIPDPITFAITFRPCFLTAIIF